MKLKAFDGQVKCQILSGFCLMFSSCRRELMPVSPRWHPVQCRMDRWSSLWGLLCFFLVLHLPVERYLPFVCILYDWQNSRIYWVYTNRETGGENVSLKAKLDSFFESVPHILTHFGFAVWQVLWQFSSNTKPATGSELCRGCSWTWEHEGCFKNVISGCGGYHPCAGHAHS